MILEQFLIVTSRFQEAFVHVRIYHAKRDRVNPDGAWREFLGKRVNNSVHCAFGRGICALRFIAVGRGHRADTDKARAFICAFPVSCRAHQFHKRKVMHLGHLTYKFRLREFQRTIDSQTGAMNQTVNRAICLNQTVHQAVDPGNIVQVEYAKAIKGPYIASSLRVVMDVSDSLKDYASSCYLMYLEELSLSLFQYGDKFPYEEMKIIINALKDKKDVLSLSILTLGVLHHVLGIEINTDDCISCHKSKNIVSYDLSEGGFICSDCFFKYDASLKDKIDLFVLNYAFSSLS